MFDCETLAKARAAATRLDGQLRDLELQRQRLETEISCVRTIIGLCEPAANALVRRQPGSGNIVSAVAISNSTSSDIAASNKRSKPDGLPSVAKMIVSVLEEAAADGYHGFRPCDLAEIVRKTWQRDVQTKVVNTIAWKMAKDGKLVKDGSVYRLPVRGSHSRPSAELMLNQSDIGGAALTASRDCAAAPA